MWRQRLIRKTYSSYNMLPKGKDANYKYNDRKRRKMRRSLVYFVLKLTLKEKQSVDNLPGGSNF